MNERIQKWLKNHLVNCEYTEFGWQECHRYEFDEDEIKEFAQLIVAAAAAAPAVDQSTTSAIIDV